MMKRLVEYSRFFIMLLLYVLSCNKGTYTPTSNTSDIYVQDVQLDFPQSHDKEDIFWADHENDIDKIDIINNEIYHHIKPPAGPVATILQGNTWIKHFTEDILPFWTNSVALGSIEGNFPTWRGMDGSLQASTDRMTRMIGRQTWFYAVGYLMTGDETLLEHSRAGVDWLLNHAKDKDYGGWYRLLDENGHSKGQESKYAQDTAYCILGLAAYYFVTRDKEVEKEILEARDLLFDPSAYWDEINHRIKDGLSFDLSTEVDQENDGGWELVAQLDPVNAFMLLVQPVLSSEPRRKQFLSDLRILSQTLIDQFWQDGIFWGVNTNKGKYESKHVDFGHTLKSYWMILQVDKRLVDHPFHDFLMENVYTWVDKAYDQEYGRWGKRMTDSLKIEYGSDWWIYAEADQFAATLNLISYQYTPRLELTLTHWLSDYVDKTQPVREVVPSIKRNGDWVLNWPNTDTAKCNEWKNGFHSGEHALVLYIMGNNLEQKEINLYFAAAEASEDFMARPYLFEGKETSRQKLGNITIAGQKFEKVKVSFTEIF